MEEEAGDRGRGSVLAASRPGESTLCGGAASATQAEEQEDKGHGS